MPERRTKMIPAKAARSSTRGRPPLGLAIPNQRAHAGFVRRSKWLDARPPWRQRRP
jgi:hypothetical protein